MFIGEGITREDYNVIVRTTNELLMPFNSFPFWLIFPFVFVIYWAIPTKWNIGRKLFLILTSYLLYMNWKPAYALVLLGVTLITFFGGYLLSNHENKFGRIKGLVWLFALLGLLPLIIFKYFNFVNENLSAALARCGLQFALPGLNWTIPMGISFFSFQAVGYMLDVYHGRVQAEKNILDYILFVSFFPQVMSGPISKADELLPQIKSAHSFNYGQAVRGLKYLLWGMFLKVVLADRAGIYVDTVFASYGQFSGGGCALASALYSIQIYADFSGYSFMAMGIAKILGFDLINNFKRPYFATSVSEFWKRWHISLTRWLTQQVYIPLGGSRCSRIRTYWNIIVTFLVSGIWHGANWTFIIWGMIHGVLQILEKSIGWNKKVSKGIRKALRIVVTFTIITFAWVIFRSASLDDAFGLIGRFFTTNGSFIADSQALLHILLATTPLLLFEFGREFIPGTIASLQGITSLRWFAYLTITAMIVLFGVHDGSSFIYVSF